MAKTPRSADETATSSETDSTASGSETVIGKGHATPTRKEREAANKRPLVPSDRRQAGRDSREKERQAREKARVGMANGDERYLPLRDKGPQKRWVRDYVDARLSFGELVLPLLVVVLATYMLPLVLPEELATEVTAIALIGVWAYILLAIIEGFIITGIIKRKLAAKFGEGKVERGVRFYGFMRMIQLRPLRMPKPQVKRGEFPS